MSESGYKNEFLFVLGNGASIASADPKVKKLIKALPSIADFVDVMVEIDQGRWNIELQTSLGDIITDILYHHCVERVVEISKEKNDIENDKKLNVSELLNILVQNSCSGDVDNLIIAIFITIISYYKNINTEYYLKLWEVVREKKSPVISLNWDANFERVVYEKLDKQISMKHFYGQFMSGHLIASQRDDPYKPVVEVMKPHGSLNWHFDRHDSLVISDSIYSGPWVDDELHANSFLIPPLAEENWKNWHGYRPRMMKIRDDINRRIRECAACTRTLVIIGYSFPGIDKHIKNLFADNRFENVRVFDKNKKVFKRIKGYFPKARHEFKEGGFAEIMNWPDEGEK